MVRFCLFWFGFGFFKLAMDFLEFSIDFRIVWWFIYFGFFVVEYVTIWIGSFLLVHFLVPFAVRFWVLLW